jgi:hypothetical protein
MTTIEEYEAAIVTLRKVQRHVAELAKIHDPFGKSPDLIEAFEKVINHMHSTVFDWRDRDRFLRKKYGD